MTEEAMFSCAALAVEKFARSLIQHPRFEEDPVCVTATLAEKYAGELRSAEPVTWKQKLATAVLTHPNGHVKKNGRYK